MKKERNSLLTGIPRSGTTLCCRMLNSYSDTLALVEPFSVAELSRCRNHEEACEKILKLVEESRYLAESGTALSKHTDGKIATNIIAEDKHVGELRTEQVQLGQVTLDRALSPSGTMIVKHNAMFAALLSCLQKEITMYALIRNPLSVLASWNSVDLPVNKGHLPAGELFCPELRFSLNSEENLVSRQLIILDWFFKRFSQVPLSRLLRYENLALSGVKEIQTIVGKGAESNFSLNQIENQNSSYEKDVLLKLADALLSSDGAYWDFYSKTDIEALLEYE